MQISLKEYGMKMNTQIQLIKQKYIFFVVSGRFWNLPDNACVSSGVLLLGVNWPFVRSTVKVSQKDTKHTHMNDTENLVIVK